MFVVRVLASIALVGRWNLAKAGQSKTSPWWIRELGDTQAKVCRID